MENNEELKSKQRALELWDKDIISTYEVGTFKGLSQIHAFRFQDVFEFAGKLRTVNLAKGNFRFAPVLFLKSNLDLIDRMPDSTFDEIVDKYVEMNVAHPFREGNGRATRLWLDALLKNRLALCVDWSKIDKYDYLSAMERSPVNSLEIKTLLKHAITDDIHDRQVYMRGIQASYRYENMHAYNIEDLK